MDTPNRPRDIRLVPALNRAVRILDLVSAPDQRLTVSDIARHLSLPKSSVHGLCATLVACDLLQKRSDQSYRIGPHIMRWSNAFTRNIDVTDEFLTMLDTESDFPGPTITLSVRNGPDVVYVAARNSERHPNFFTFKIGQSLPAAFTATGKAFLMAMHEAEVRRLYSGSFPQPMTPNSVRDMNALIVELQTFRPKGYSVDDGQVREGMRCYGRTILDGQNRPIAGVAISIPADTLTSDDEARIVRTLQRFADVISRRMGSDET